jgi:hypothetical protein
MRYIRIEKTGRTLDMEMLYCFLRKHILKPENTSLNVPRNKNGHPAGQPFSIGIYRVRKRTPPF